MKHRMWGVILLGTGVLALLQGLGVYYFGLAFWPVVLVLLGGSLVWSCFSRHRFLSWFRLGLGLWVGAIGLFEILFNAGVTSITAGEIVRFGWPILLIALGLSVLFGRRFCFVERDCCGKSFRAGRRQFGDLYHGREPWVLDGDLDLEHGVGDAVVDLTTADITEGKHAVTVKVSIGELLIRIPDNVSAEIDATVGVGELAVLDEKRSGVGGLKIKKKIEREGAAADLHIMARLGVGELEVALLPSLPGANR